MAGTDFSHLTNDELIKGIQALNLPDYIRSKAYGIDVRETLAQMTEMTIQLGVNMGLSPDDALKWARKLQESISQSEFDSWVATLLDGGPSIFMNTLNELKAAYPKGASGVALVRETDPAKIYVWNGSAWQDFGAYQGIEIKDGSITTDKLAEHSVTFDKTNFLKEGKNKFNGEYTKNLTVNGKGLVVKPDVSTTYAAIVEVIPETTYSITKLAGGNRLSIAIVDQYPSSDVLPLTPLHVVRGENSSLIQMMTVDVPTNGRYMVILTNLDNETLPLLQVEEGEYPTHYEPYKLGFESPIVSPVVEKSNKNIFEGNYVRGYITPNMGGEVARPYESIPITTITPIEPNQTYTATKYEGGNRFTLMVIDVFPTSDVLPIRSLYTFRGLESASKQSHTFTSPSNGKYLVSVVAIDIDSYPNFQVEKGTQSTPYEPYIMIDNSLLPETLSSPSPEESSPKSKVFKTDSAIGITDWESTAHTDVYRDYDNLADEAPDGYITSRVLTTLSTGEEIKHYTFSSNEMYHFEGNVWKPKVIITSGLHGSEKNSVASTFQLLEKITKDWRKHPVLEFLRFNVDFEVIPVTNPTGFDTYTRPNQNGVDLNRNFPNDNVEGGNYSDRQEEVIALIDFLHEHKDADLFIDAHRTWFHSHETGRTHAGYIISGSDGVIKHSNRIQGEVFRTWQKHYDFVDQSDNAEYGYTRAPIAGSLSNYASNFMNGLVVEIAETINWNSNGSKYDSYVIEYGIDLLAHILYELVKIEMLKHSLT